MTTESPRLPGSPGRWRNTDQISRMLARFISVGYLAYLAILLPPITALAPRMESWWTPVAMAMVFGSGLAPGALSFGADIRWVRRAAASAATLFLAAVVSWPTAWNGPDILVQDGVWLAAFPGLASLAAAIAWPPLMAFTHLVVACLGVQLLNAVARDGMPVAMLLPEVLFAITFCTLFVGGAVMALRTGRLLDATTEEAHAAAAIAAAERARGVERERFDALTHDNVMVTLLAASRSQPQERVRSLAAGALGELDAIRAGTGADEPFSLDRALSHLRAAVADADERAGFIVVHDGSLESIPAECARALGSALAEAVRNSRLHAGDGTERSVTVTVSDLGIVIDAEDNGVGFDPTTVPPHRLGVAVSIRGRMTRLPGGSAHIETTAGAGTTVRLEWRRP